MNRVPQDMLDEALDRQKNAWLDGSRPSVEELLHDSSLPAERDVLLDLIYNEIVVREELGETPTLEEYSARYPALDEDLRLHFEVHRAVHDRLLVDTRPVHDAESLADIDPVSFEMGPKLSEYEIVGELGRGGMGIVYKARQRRLKRFVALKMFQPGRRPSPRELARFRAEAEAIARLQHGNIVQIFEVGQEHGLPFLALELVEQGTLQQKLQDLPYAPRAAAELIETLARAIQHAHEHQIVHRDLKPANVLFAADGTPKITDFGLAKLLEADRDEPHDATRTGEPIGTPRYMAPEQAEGKTGAVGPATDVYALGTMLYECLTGQVPFVSASVVETVDKIRHEQPVPPRRLQRSLPRDLETICLQCLHKQPGRRYQTARALAEDLLRFRRGEPIQARRTPAWERGWMWCRRRPAVAALLASTALLILGAAAGFGAWRQLERQRLEEIRGEIVQLMKEGQLDLARGDARQAKERFQAALAKAQAEPGLSAYELGVRGWLDHSQRMTEQQRWKQRNPPPLFDERRDDAFVQYVLADVRQPESLAQARQAIAGAFDFTVADDPAWHLEREGLLLLEADLALRDGGGAKALAVLDTAAALSTRLGHLRRAAYLQALERKGEADAELRQAEKFIPALAFEAFFRGLQLLHTFEEEAAVHAFDQALAREPDHFLARLCQAAAFLKLKRPTEAKVALTACMGQRPRFAWNYLLRCRAYLQLGDLVACAQDLQSATELRLNKAAQQHLDTDLTDLGKAVDALPEERQESFWSAQVITDAGPRPLRELAILLRFHPSQAKAGKKGM